MYGICSVVVNEEARFTQLGCGWLVRELSMEDRVRAIEFIRENMGKFSSEGLSYATEKLSPQRS
jgi:hypothetical protein